LIDLLYFYDLLKNLHKYIWHCPQCQLSQTLHHKPYDALQPIITPLLKKFYLVYLSIQLLSQQIDALDLMTLKDKLVTIFRIRFSLSLSQLEKYLSLTDYLWQYISHYTAIIKSLQQQKTFLNQGLWVKETKENAKKQIIIIIRLNESILKKLNIFHHLQSLFSWSIILMHFSSKQQLYIDLDVFKEFNFEVYVYHAKEFTEDSTSKQKFMKSVLFLSRLLQDIKMQYWLTELEVTELIWIVKKIRHIIEVTAKNVIIYTDHAVSVKISH